MGPIDYQSQLVNNEVETLKCKDLTHRLINPVFDGGLYGDIEHFWSPECLSEAEFFIGAFHLFEERIRGSQSENRYA
jgi:hypothetical protein